MTTVMEMSAITAQNKRLKTEQQRRAATRQRLVYALLIFGAVMFMLPLILMVSTSLKPLSEIFTYPPSFFPKTILLQNYVNAWNFKNTNFPLWTRNTLIIILGTLPGVVATSSLCAYGFARLKFRGRNLWFGLVLASIMLPPQVTLIPLYILFFKIGWLNTFLPLIVPAWFGGGALNIFLQRQFFMQIPRELDEAAIIDGAGHLRIWWSIYVPLSRPVMVSVILLTILGIWNDFLGPLIYLTSPQNFTLAIGLSNFSGTLSTPRTDYLMAISSIMVIPMIILFLFSQRYIVQGFVTSGLKG